MRGFSLPEVALRPHKRCVIIGPVGSLLESLVRVRHPVPGLLGALPPPLFRLRVQARQLQV